MPVVLRAGASWQHDLEKPAEGREQGGRGQYRDQNNFQRLAPAEQRQCEQKKEKCADAEGSRRGKRRILHGGEKIAESGQRDQIQVEEAEKEKDFFEDMGFGPVAFEGLLPQAP